MFRINKKRIVLYAILAMIAWSFVITTYSEQISQAVHWQQFLIVSGIGYAFPSIIIGKALSKDLKKIAGAWFFLVAIDLVFPPLLVGLDGSFVGAGILFNATPDKLFFELWKGFGFEGSALFLLVYPVSYIIMTSIAVYLLTEKQLWNLANGGG